jgi:hypothetical protein
MKTFLTIILFTIAKISFSQSTAYGYVKRDSTSYVNYAEIGNNLSSTLLNARTAYIQKLKDAGWSSEEEYLEYKRTLRKQKKLKRKYDHGSKGVGLTYDNNGDAVYFIIK